MYVDIQGCSRAHEKEKDKVYVKNGIKCLFLTLNTFAIYETNDIAL